MADAIRYLVWMLTRLVIPLRYRVKVDGWNQIQGIKGPVLLLPNHPGMIDPVLVLATFFGAFHPRTVLFEGNFPGLIRPLLIKLLRAVPVPDLARPSQEAHQRVEQAIAEVIAGLRRGENFVLWPSGKAQRDGVERLGAARALTDILREVPDAKIVLIRTQGVWGSTYSFAPTGQLPDLGRCLLKSAILLVSNLFVLMPRRNVKISVERIDRQELPELDRDAINRWFETRYNPQGPESPTFVPYHFLFGPRSYQFPPSPNQPEDAVDADQIPSETRQAITEILSERLGRSLDSAELVPETTLENLGLDSLQRMDLTHAVEQRFSVAAESTPETFGQLLALAEGVSEKGPRQAPQEWSRAPSRVEPVRIMGQTIPEAFVTRALSNLSEIAVADDFSGVVSYRRLLIGALLMSRRFARLPGKNVGLMLPASVASDIMLFGLYFSKKLPVLLNWTTGSANLQHSVELTEITHVITSKALRDRLGDTVQMKGVTFLNVEDLQRQVGWLEKICCVLLLRCLPGIVRRFVPQLPPDERAVILFTSGSEKAPKGVPLTHANVMSNVRIVPDVLDLTNGDALLGFLPMFHSFGFTVTGLFPLLAGVRVIHHADPTDAAGLIRKIASYSPTVIVGMPSIIGHLLERARPTELDSLKVIALGAEACPSALFEKARAVVPNAVALEGYGVTECSPLIAGNRPNANRPGTVGQPLPGIEVRVTDPESNQVLPSGKRGILVVSGPGVFPGYLGDEPSPFVNLEGKRWYVTGDLVEIDSDGFIHFQGRLKRFVKAGGEMISLPALEEPFARRYPPDNNGPHAAVEGVETDKGRNIVLFTTESLDLNDANAFLIAEGLRGVLHLDQVRRLDKIPVLGTGKIDYRQLRTMIKEEAPPTTKEKPTT